MPFKVSHDRWLSLEADRLGAIIEMPRYWHRAWTPQSLKQELEETQHLEYSLQEVREINDELHRRGIVEDTGP